MSKSWMKSGAAAFEAAKRAEAQKAKSRNYQPSRFFLKDGEEAEIVILDESFDDVVGFWEHNLKVNGKWGNFEVCLGENENCPICLNVPDSKPYYVMMVSILDLRGYTDKNGNDIPYTRKLLPLKGELIELFKQIADAAQKKNGTLRGTTLVMKRSGDKSYSTGKPQMLEDATLFAHTPNETLIEEFGHDEVKTKTGDVIIPENGKLDPIDYESSFERHTADELCEKYGWEPMPGGKKSIAKMLEEDGTKKPARVEKETRKVDTEEKPKRRLISRVAKKQDAEEESAPWEDDD
jgi:hypothetical protein